MRVEVFPVRYSLLAHFVHLPATFHAPLLYVPYTFRTPSIHVSIIGVTLFYQGSCTDFYSITYTFLALALFRLPHRRAPSNPGGLFG